MSFPEIPPGTNPAMSPEGTHVATPRLCFADGQLHQLWNPCDWSADAPQWRPVDAFVTQANPAPVD